jgi:hypothetical protein
MIQSFTLRPVQVLACQYNSTEDVPALTVLGAQVVWTTFGPYPQVNGNSMNKGEWLVRFADTGELKVYPAEKFPLRFDWVSA